MDEPWEVSTQRLTHERNDTQLPADHPQILVPNVDIKEYIGGGQFGWVYAGLVRTTGLVIAVKVLRNECFESTSLVARRAANEAIIGAKLAHRNIMGIFDLRPVGRFWIILMELVQGKSLAQSDISSDKMRSYFGQLADALYLMVNNRIVHRDIKPDNIVLRKIDESPVVVDLGLAVDLSLLDPAEAGIAGTPYFMPPEALNGEISSAFDAYSLGVTAAFTIVKDDYFFSFPGGMAELFRAKASGEFSDRVKDALNNTDSELRNWILNLLSMDTETRLRALQEGRKWFAH